MKRGIRLFILFFGCLMFSLPTWAQEQHQIDTLYAQKTYQKAQELFEQNHFDSASKVFKEAADIFITHNAYVGYFDAENRIVEILRLQYKIKDAFNLAKKLQKEAESTYKSSIGEIMSITSLGYIHTEMGNYDLANFTLETVKNKTNKASLLTDIYLALGDLNFWRDKPKEALDYYRLALEKSISFYGEAHYKTTTIYTHLAQFFRVQGNYGFAIEYAEKGQKIIYEMLGSHNVWALENYLVAADIYLDKRSYEKAKEYYDEVQVMTASLFSEAHPYNAYCLYGEGLIFLHKKEYEEAKKYFEHALDIFQQTSSEYHPGAIQVYLGMGNMYLDKQNYDWALEYYNKVIDINYDLRGEINRSSSNAYNNLGSIYYFDGDYEMARQNFKKALEIDQTIYGQKHPNVANAYYNISKVYEEEGRLETSLEFLQQALCASFADFHEENIYENPKLKNYFDENDLFFYLRFKAETLHKGFEKRGSADVRGLSIAMETYKLAAQLVDSMRQSHTEEEDKIELSKDAHNLYESGLTASFDLLRYTNPYNMSSLNTTKTLAELQQEYIKNAFYFSEKNRGSVLAASIADAKAKSFGGGIPDSLIQQEELLKAEIAKCKLELASKPDSATAAFYKEKLFFINRVYEQLISYYEKTFPKYYELKHNPQMASIEDVQSVISPTTAIISYFNTKENLYALYLTKKGLTIHKIEKKADFDASIESLRKTILFKMSAPYGQVAHKLYSSLFPVNVPSDINKLVIIPDGNTSTIPFETLLTENPEPDANFSDMPFLVKKYEISYSFSMNLYYQMHSESKENPFNYQGKDFVAIAPVFEESILPPASGESKRNTETGTSVDSHTVGDLVRKGEVSALPGTEEEIKIIGDLFKSHTMNAETFLYHHANEPFVKNGGLADYRFIHVATHGFVNLEKPELSGVLLLEDHQRTEDGFLYSGEIYNLRLHSELIVLSACETGLGKIAKGEGVIGLSRALLYAGARNLIVSLWKVADASTAQLMIDFYKNMLNDESAMENNKPSSLRAAKLKMIQEGEYAAPYYWSPFILIGL